MLIDYVDDAILFLAGIAIGSFLNVVSLRYRPDRPLFANDILRGRSYCPHCGKILRWYELIPLISFIIQLGKCRSCKQPLSWQYPVVELATGIVFVSLPGIVSGWVFGSIWGLAILTLILLSVIDARLKIIPDQLNVFLAFLGLALAAAKAYYGIFGHTRGSFVGRYALLFGFRENVWLNHLVAAGVGLLIFTSIMILSRGKGMGMGDVKLAGALGLLLGWPDIILSIMFAFIVGSLYALALMALRRKTFKDAVPFGPFLAVGVLIVMFFGEQILSAYFKLFSII